MSLENFDPRLLEAWRLASKEPVRIPVTTRAQAITLRHRLYRLRAELRTLEHPLSKSAERAKVSIVAIGPSKFEVVVAPADDEFDAALRAAKLEVPPPEALESSFPELEEPEETERLDPLEELLQTPPRQK